MVYGETPAAGDQPAVFVVGDAEENVAAQNLFRAYDLPEPNAVHSPRVKLLLEIRLKAKRNGWRQVWQ